MARATSPLSGLGAAFDTEYDALPEAIKAAVTIKEFAWMDPARRARLTDEFTMPDPTED